MAYPLPPSGAARLPCHRQRGYSLIEMAVVLAVLSLVTGGMLSVATMRKERQNLTSINEKFDAIEDALERYLSENEHLPCPAPTDEPENTAEFARATDCTAAAPAGTVDVGSGADAIRIGVAPTRSLGLTDAYLYDPWRNRITYAVIKDIAKPGADFVGYTTSQTTGVIQIVDLNGNQVTNDVPHANGYRTVIPYILLSHGPDKQGAYNRLGTVVEACDAATKDGENCDAADAVFRDTDIADSTTAANYFHDYARWKEKSFLVGDAEEEEECEAPTSGLIGHWKFDEASGSTTAADSSASGNNGTLTNMTPATDWVSGKIGGALNFSGGASTIVDVGNDPALALTNYTISLWFQWHSVHPTDAYRALIGKNQSGGGHGKYDNYLLLVKDSDGHLLTRVGDGTNAPEWDSGVDVADGQWHHTVLAYSSADGTLSLYVDGVETNSDTGLPSAYTDAAYAVYIGAWLYSYGEWDGLIDDVRIYNRPLDAGEIDLLYNDGEGCEN